MAYQQILRIETKKRGAVEITTAVANSIAQADIKTGLCHIFIHHTSASLMICENDDPDVLRDLEAFMARLIADGDPLFKHTIEGEDDMPAHIRSVLTHTDLTIPITQGKLALGTWQGIFLYEHRYRSHQRQITVTVI